MGPGDEEWPLLLREEESWWGPVQEPPDRRRAEHRPHDDDPVDGAGRSGTGALAGRPVVFFLANGTTSPDAARSFAGTVAGLPTWAHDAVAAASEGGLVVLGLLLVATAWRARFQWPRQVATVILGVRASCWRSSPARC